MPKALNLFDRVVYLSHKIDKDRFLDQKLSQRLGLRNGRVVPNGVDVSAHDGAPHGFRKKYGVSDSSLMVLCVGKYATMKNEAGVASAFLRSGVSDATLVMIGPEINAYAQDIITLWESAPHRKQDVRLLCLGGLSSSEILAAYRDADLFVQASRTECFPLVLLDAMASRTAFISTDVGCVRDLPGGITVHRECELSSAIRRLADGPALRAELAENGRRACEHQYSWDCISSQYAQLIDELCTGVPSCRA